MIIRISNNIDTRVGFFEICRLKNNFLKIKFRLHNPFFSNDDEAEFEDYFPATQGWRLEKETKLQQTILGICNDFFGENQWKHSEYDVDDIKSCEKDDFDEIDSYIKSKSWDRPKELINYKFKN